MQAHKTVSREEWLDARRALLAKEKEHLRAQDELARQRRELPWVRVDKTYAFEGPDGKETLSDLFAGRSQLIVQHFMLGPGWPEGCTRFPAHVMTGMFESCVALVLARSFGRKSVSRKVWQTAPDTVFPQFLRAMA